MVMQMYTKKFDIYNICFVNHTCLNKCTYFPFLAASDTDLQSQHCLMVFVCVARMTEKYGVCIASWELCVVCIASWELCLYKKYGVCIASWELCMVCLHHGNVL